MQHKVSLEGMPEFAGEVLREIEKRRADMPSGAFVLFLTGDLGAGKTTFMQALARILGVIEPVQSPTYVLMKSYAITRSGFSRLVHIDCYRLASAAELSALEPERLFADSSALVCIEWPEKAQGALPQPNFSIHFEAAGGADVRLVTTR